MSVIDTYIGLAIVILCITGLVAVAGIFGYKVSGNKEKLVVQPAKANDKLNDSKRGE